MKRLLVLILLLVCGIPAPSFAHPETGLLPDAIAETEYRIVLEINPKDIQTRNRLGIVLYRKSKLREAEREFAEVLRSAPKDFDAHDGMGLVKLRQGMTADAIAWFQKAIALNGEDTMVHHGLGLALEQAGRLREAEASYRRGLEVNDRLLRTGSNREKELERRAVLSAALQSLRDRMKQSKGMQ
ncbi:tetratricopeptide repeat protein [Geobacter pickeringii]|uniref:Uncharacterized protein n=1 Tax=Geobacter pickeringii TaxID=345632 RepID=A0A0B5B7E8_9BACT|nr:tetratricopeptide repeat protein [Geobacter pickeringii]AJE02482.1 hypothetical protein GPICK_03000 [Geobacter pickeringii]